MSPTPSTIACVACGSSGRRLVHMRTLSLRLVAVCRPCAEDHVWLAHLEGHELTLAEAVDRLVTAKATAA